MTETEVGIAYQKKTSPEDGEVNIDGFAKLICKLVGSGGPRVDRVVRGGSYKKIVAEKGER